MDFSFLRSKKSDVLHVDIHSHILPGVDDGSKSMSESLEILRGLESLGYQKAITTPHIYPELYPNKEADLLEALPSLRDAAVDAGLRIEVGLAAEYFVDGTFLERLKEKSRFLTFGDRYLLMETAFGNLPLFWEEVLFESKAQGFKPVLAHPERFTYVMDDITMLSRWRKIGLLFQVSLPSLVGFYGSTQKKLALQIIKLGYCDFLGSDIHSPSHLPVLQKALKTRARSVLRGRSMLNKSLR